jgi:hypothetical protein
LMYRNTTDFHILILYHLTLLNLFIWKVLVVVLGFVIVVLVSVCLVGLGFFCFDVLSL